MPNQVDMNAALMSFQDAYKKRYIMPMRCALRSDLWILKDDADGETRLTYALIDNAGTVKGIVSVLPADPYEGKRCFGLAYAVAEPFRGQGFGKQIVEDSIAEIRNGFKRHFSEFYVEVVVDKQNVASQKVASSVISEKPIEIIDQFSGDSALQYFRLVN